jgi:hypothetical protein
MLGRGGLPVGLGGYEFFKFVEWVLRDWKPGFFSIFDREKRGFLLRLSQENQSNEFWFLIAQAPEDSRQNHEHTPANDAKKPLLIQPAMIYGCMMLYGIVELLMYFLGHKWIVDDFAMYFPL